MKRLLTAALCLVWLTASAAPAPTAASTNAPPAVAKKTQAELDEIAKAWVFPVGEEIVYTLYWGIIPVGRATVTASWVEFEGRTLLRVHARAVSNSVIAKLYPVDDNMESLIDPVTCRPVKFIKKMRRGRHK